MFINRLYNIITNKGTHVPTNEGDKGMEFKTTFRQDFSIADRFGVEAVKDTFRRAFYEWRDNVEYVTELVIVLNWKIWEYYETNPRLAEVYEELWRKADEWCKDNLVGDELRYYYEITD